MKTYKGIRTPTLCAVTVTASATHKYTLPITPTGKRHSPTGFEWGYTGSGPAALAHAILYDFMNSTHIADRLYMAFKDEIVGEFASDSWEITEATINGWIERKHAALEMSRDAHGEIDPQHEV